MNNVVANIRCEVLVLGKWVVASVGWSAVERDAYLRAHPQDATVRFVTKGGAK